MKRVEESILSQDYKKHIQVGSSSPAASPSISREVQVWATGKPTPSSRTELRPDTLTSTRVWKKQCPHVTEGEGKVQREAYGMVKCSGSGFRTRCKEQTCHLAQAT